MTCLVNLTLGAPLFSRNFKSAKVKTECSFSCCVLKKHEIHFLI